MVCCFSAVVHSQSRFIIIIVTWAKTCASYRIMSGTLHSSGPLHLEMKLCTRLKVRQEIRNEMRL